MAGENWPKLPLGELTKNFDSIRVPIREASRRRGPYPYYGASGIVDYVDGYLFDGLYLLIAEDGENLRTLASLRDALLPKLLSGELRLKEAEKLVDAVK
jgi:hypothetical protein